MSSYNEFDKLTPQEREVALKILQDLSSGNTDSFNKLKYQDYNEIPVSINTFLHDEKYLGKGLIDKEGRFTVFPFWIEVLEKIFPTNIDIAYNTLVLSGAIGIGKSFVAVICMLYLLYRMLCLKDPYQHYGLQPIDRITFSMLNLTMDAAKGVGWSKMQELLQVSPWFMQHGWVDDKREAEWHPSNNIELLYGSQTKHIIGRAIYCLDGDTEILTSKGLKKIKDCVDKNIKVISYTPSGCDESISCSVKATVKTNKRYKITFSNNKNIFCTDTHRFLLDDNHYCEAKDLKLDSKLKVIDGTLQIKSIDIEDTEDIQYYDVIDALPYNNFLIRVGKSFIVSHNCNFLDEASFRQNEDIDKQKKYAMELVSTADARMQSRFMKGEKLPTLHIIASSKRTDQSFLESYIDMKKKNESKTTLIIDEPQWVIRTDKNSDRKFPVALGNKFLESEVLKPDTDEEELQKYRDRGYQILMVPMGYYENFLDDLDIALTDIAGVSTSNNLRYISGARWAQCKSTKIKNPFTKEIITVGNGLDDHLQYKDFFNLDLIPKELMQRPLYIHMDMSVSGDKTGIAGVWIIGKKPPKENEPPSKELFFQLAFSVSIKAPKGYQISFEKNRQFIYFLKDEGFHIAGISTDTFQSYDTGQSLKAKGYNYNIVSVDKVNTDHICEPYQYFKNTIYEGRILVYETKILTEEVIGLERSNSGHIDHSVRGINSKDCSDAVCGAVFSASKDAEKYAFDYNETLDTVTKFNSEDEGTTKQIVLNFEEELKKAKEAELKNNSSVDFGMGLPKELSSDIYYLSQGIII